MIKNSIIYSLVICLSIVTIGSLFNIDRIIEYIEPETKAVISLDNYSGEPIEGEGIRAVYSQNQQLEELQIVDDKYVIDTVSVGDSIDKIYEVHNGPEVIEYENSIKVFGGQKDHYGVMTEYTQYIKGDNQTVQEIRTGYTTPFTSVPLIESNAQVKEELQGMWVSDTDRTIEFQEEFMKDSYLDGLWDIQTYHVVSPNEILIKRVDDTHTETVKMNVWLDEETLYLFTVDKHGIPIEESIETFNVYKE